MTGTNYTGLSGLWNNGQHVYLSTACLHDNHQHCQGPATLEGEPKIPATCKWCAAPCICWCHTAATRLDT